MSNHVLAHAIVLPSGSTNCREEDRGAAPSGHKTPKAVWVSLDGLPRVREMTLVPSTVGPPGNPGGKSPSSAGCTPASPLRAVYRRVAYRQVIGGCVWSWVVQKPRGSASTSRGGWTHRTRLPFTYAMHSRIGQELTSVVG